MLDRLLQPMPVRLQHIACCWTLPAVASIRDGRATVLDPVRDSFFMV